MELKEQSVSPSIDETVINLRTIMSNSSDLTIKHAKAGGHRICIIFCEGMASTGTMADLIFQPINSLTADMPLKELVRTLEDGLIIAGEQKQSDTYSDICADIMSGFVAILIEGLDRALSVGVQGYAARSVEQPSTHSNVRGSRDGFVEVVRTNVSLVRRRMKNTDLVFKMMKLGDMSQTDVCMCYIKNTADKRLVREVEKRLKALPLNTILEGGYIQPFLENPGNQLFSEVGATERPDVFTAKLHEGKVGVLIDGTPFALYLPKLFMENFSVIDDYTGRPFFTALIRVIRYLAIIFATVVSGFYVALANFNPELFPEALLLNLATSIQDTPYPLLAECLVIHVFYEVMREAGLRIPTNIGHAVSIVGGLVIGDIVVSAGLVGAPMVLMVAMSAITSFVVPDLYDSIAVLRFAYIIVGGMWGLFGITVLSALIAVKLCSQESYGVPHTAPVSPFSPKALRDLIVRRSWRKMAERDYRVQDLAGVNVGETNE
ncbi:MAG: spore germination protein [Bacteroides sp.]|nr:spore germination protein [Bacteroides sp.]